jgi:hypothetical protein
MPCRCGIIPATVTSKTKLGDEAMSEGTMKRLDVCSEHKRKIIPALNAGIFN